jgi:hypothetical protein
VVYASKLTIRISSILIFSIVFIYCLFLFFTSPNNLDKTLVITLFCMAVAGIFRQKIYFPEAFIFIFYIIFVSTIFWSQNMVFWRFPDYSIFPDRIVNSIYFSGFCLMLFFTSNNRFFSSFYLLGIVLSGSAVIFIALIVWFLMDKRQSRSILTKTSAVIFLLLLSIISAILRGRLDFSTFGNFYDGMLSIDRFAMIFSFISMFIEFDSSRIMFGSLSTAIPLDSRYFEVLKEVNPEVFEYLRDSKTSSAFLHSDHFRTIYTYGLFGYLLLFLVIWRVVPCFSVFSALFVGSLFNTLLLSPLVIAGILMMKFYGGSCSGAVKS